MFNVFDLLLIFLVWELSKVFLFPKKKEKNTSIKHTKSTTSIDKSLSPKSITGLSKINNKLYKHCRISLNEILVFVEDRDINYFVEWFNLNQEKNYKIEITLFEEKNKLNCYGAFITNIKFISNNEIEISVVFDYSETINNKKDEKY